MKKKSSLKNNALKTHVKNVFVVYRSGTDSAKAQAIELIEWLKNRGIAVYTHKGQKLPGSKGKFTPRLAKSVQLAIVLGGDGTYLEAVRELDGATIPILGVNMGSLGFLTVTKIADIYDVITLALENKLEQRPRSMLEIEFKRKGKSSVKVKALNDVVIERGRLAHLINLSIQVHKQHVLDVKADGLLVATPTGSTAYNLAAGGPILHPQTSAFVVTPVCPHSLTNRPLIFSDSEDLGIHIAKKSQTANVIVDGEQFGELKYGDSLLIRKADCTHYVLRKPEHNYFQLLKEKLKFGSRATM
jgi:NAD+ kinase